MLDIWICSLAKQCPFTLEGVEKISTIGWENMYLFKIDHKAGYLHVPFHRESWTYLGVEWDNEVLVFTCLAFGGSNCPVIYHSLTDATTMYIRKLDIPGLDYIDDMLFGTPTCHKHKSKEEQLNLTKRACYVTTLILFCAGYFLNKKCIFEPVRTRSPNCFKKYFPAEEVIENHLNSIF